MKFQSHSRVGLTVFVAASLFLGCGVQPAPTEEQTAALLHGGPPLLVRECERLLNDCERLRRPRLRDACVWEVLRGECGHPPHADAGRDMSNQSRDAAMDVARGPHDAAPDRVDSRVDMGPPDSGSVRLDGSTDGCPVGGCGACVGPGAACSESTPCCSGAACANGVCSVVPACLQFFAACDGTIPCCDDPIVTCTGGVCTPPSPPPCVPDGQLCTSPQTCCTGKICFGVCGMLEGGP